MRIQSKTLIVVVMTTFIYIMCGTYIFIWLEAEAEITGQVRFLERLQLLFGNGTCPKRNEFKDLLNTIVMDDLAVLQHLLNNNNTQNIKWDFYGSMTFTLTLLTAVGFGNITPRTASGRAFCVVYTLIGIPLMLICLGGIGERLSTLCTRFLKARKGRTRHPTAERRIFIISHAMLGVLILIAVPTLLGVFTQGWSVLDAIYFSIMTFTTIGFGDLIPEDPLYRNKLEDSPGRTLLRMFLAAWLLIGMSYISMAISGSVHYFVSRTVSMEETAAKGLARVLRRLSSFIVASKKGSEASVNDSEGGPPKAVGMGRRLSLNTVRTLQRLFVAKDAGSLTPKISPGTFFNKESGTEIGVAGARSEPELNGEFCFRKLSALSRISDKSNLPSSGAVSPEKGVGETGTKKRTDEVNTEIEHVEWESK